MTIGQHLQAKAASFAWPALALAVFGLALRWLPIGAPQTRIAIALGLLVTLVLLFLVLAVQFRCPRCGGPLSSLVAHFGPLRRFGRPVRCCPFCGVAMDAPLRDAPGDRPAR